MAMLARGGKGQCQRYAPKALPNDIFMFKQTKTQTKKLKGSLSRVRMKKEAADLLKEGFSPSNKTDE